MSYKNIDEYLDAVGTTAISIVKVPSGYAYRVGRETVNIDGVVNTHWVAKDFAAKIARRARFNGGPYPDKQASERALQYAAHAFNQTLTPHVVLVSRATKQAKDLEAALREMSKSGQLEAFHHEYKRQRQTAKREGKGFVSYNVAIRRLRKSLIRRLIERVPIRSPGLFNEVFSTFRPPKMQKKVDDGIDKAAASPAR
jgi:hypothetical protein